MAKDGRGGYRPGSGRKPKDEDTVFRNVRLSLPPNGWMALDKEVQEINAKKDKNTKKETTHGYINNLVQKEAESLSKKHLHQDF